MHKKLWNKDFMLLLQGNAVSSIGDVMYGVAIGYWVYEKTGSSSRAVERKAGEINLSDQFATL